MASDYLSAPQRTSREIDPLATEFIGGNFALVDLFRASRLAGGGGVIEGRVFTDCLIEGPAVMLVLDGTHFEGTNFGPTGGDMRNMLFRPLNNVAIGAIPVRDCVFRNCRFHSLGITGNEDLLQMLIEQVTTVADGQT